MEIERYDTSYADAFTKDYYSQDNLNINFAIIISSMYIRKWNRNEAFKLNSSNKKYKLLKELWEPNNYDNILI